MNNLNNNLIEGLVKLQESLGRSKNTLLSMRNAYSRVSEYMSFDEDSLKNMSKREAQDIIVKLSKEYSLSTIKQTRVFLNELFDYAEIPSVFKKVKLPTQKKNSKKDTFDFFSLEESKLLIKKAKEQKNKHSQRDCAIMSLLLSSGLRKSELISLKIKDLNIEESFVELYETKSEYYVKISISDNTMNEIVMYLNQRDDNCEALFVSSYKSAISSSGIDRIVKNIYSLANLSGTVHKTRHSVASILADMNVSITDIQSQLRHSSQSTTLKYVSQSQTRKRQIANVIGL